MAKIPHYPSTMWVESCESCESGLNQDTHNQVKSNQAGWIMYELMWILMWTRNLLLFDKRHIFPEKKHLADLFIDLVPSPTIQGTKRKARCDVILPHVLKPRWRDWDPLQKNATGCPTLTCIIVPGNGFPPWKLLGWSDSQLETDVFPIYANTSWCFSLWRGLSV